MGGLWRPAWSRVAVCCWRWRPLGPPAGVAERAERCLRPGRSGTGGAETGLRRLGTWRRPSPAGALARARAVQPPRRPKGTNPFTRAQEEEWRRRNKTVLTYVAAAAVGMLGASYAAVPLYRLYCQVGAGAAHGRRPGGGDVRGQCPGRARVQKGGPAKVTGEGAAELQAASPVLIVRVRPHGRVKCLDLRAHQTGARRVPRGLYPGIQPSPAPRRARF